MDGMLLQGRVSVTAAVILSMFWIFGIISEIPVRRHVQWADNTSGNYVTRSRRTPKVEVATTPTQSRRGFTTGRGRTPRGGISPSRPSASAPPSTEGDRPDTDTSPTVIQPDEPCRPSETLARRRAGADGRWFRFGRRPLIQFYAFSAVWDDRATSGAPLVRVLAVATSRTAGVLTVDAVPLEYGVYCRFHRPDGTWTDPVAALPLALPMGYGWWLNNRMIRELIFNCVPPAG